MNLFEKVAITSCPVCGEVDLSAALERTDGIWVMRCNRCGMGFVESRPADILSLYDDAYYSGGGELTGYADYEATASHSLAWVAQLVRLVQQGGVVLDVGCASGYLLAQLGPTFEPYGIEVNVRLAAQCRAQGIQILGPDILDSGMAQHWQGQFDVITAMAVLEHVTDIRGALENISAMLKPGGLLIFETPLTRWDDRDSIWLRSSLEHIFYPTVEGLRYLFNQVFTGLAAGREVEIANFGATFVGAAGGSPAQAAQLDRLWSAPLIELAGPGRQFRLYFDLVYAAKVNPETVALLPELPAHEWNPRLAGRLSALWKTELGRSASLLEAIEDRDSSELARLLGAEAELARLREIEAEAARLQGALRELETQIEQVRDEKAESERGWFASVENLQAEIATLARLLEGELLGQEEAERLRAEASSLRERMAYLSDREDEAARLNIELAAEQEHVKVLLESTIWRMTSPLRWGVTAARHAWTAPRSPAGRELLKKFYRAAPLPESLKRRLAELLFRRIAPSEPSPSSLPFTRAPETVVQQNWPADAPLVSVVIPCFNYGALVAGAVDSVLAQTHTDLEIIVVDGGSDDPGSVAALKALERPRTVIQWREGRHMVGDNRNFGIETARGKYVCCLDADDVLKPTYLEKALFLLETQAYDVASTSYELFGERTGEYRVQEHPTLADLVRGNQLATCAVFRRKLWAEAGGFVDTGRGADHLAEDWRLWIRLAALGARIVNISTEPLFSYRVHSGSLSHGSQVPSPVEQRAALVSSEAALLTAEAFALSEERKLTPVQVSDPFVNFVRRSGKDERTAILIAFPFLLVGGAERVMSQVVEQLGSSGFRVVMVTTLPAEGLSDASRWFGGTTQEIYHLPRFLDSARWPDFVSYLIETKNIRVLWVVGSTFFYDRLPALRSRYPDLRVIDLLFNTVGHTANNRKHAANIDLNIVENAEVEHWLIDAGESPDRIRRIGSGVDLARFQPTTCGNDTPAGLDAPCDSFVVGFSGRMSEEKAPGDFVRIAGRLRPHLDLHFVMTGSGPLEGAVRRQIDRMALGRKLSFVGHVDDVRPFLGRHDVLVVPSRLDGRPAVILESLAMGVPVIASSVGGIPELIAEGETGFLCPAGDLEAFSERIAWLSNHPEERARMAKAARAFAEAELGADVMKQAYLETVLGLLDPG
ncbi:MAG: glycosyltransferase [Actinomycetota bacterium]